MQLLTNSNNNYCQLNFHPNSSSASGVVGNDNDANADANADGDKYKLPLPIVKAYFRLIKCALEPATIIDVSRRSTTTSSLTEDEWARLASDLLKKVGDLLKVAIQTCAVQHHHQLLSSTRNGVTNSSSNISSNINNSNDTTSTIGGGGRMGLFIGQSSTKNNNNNDNDNNATSSILYYLQSILQTIHPHIPSQVRLLGPTYRCFCDVVESFMALLHDEKNCMDKFVTAFAPTVGWHALSSLSSDVERLACVWKECNSLLNVAGCQLLELADGALDTLRDLLLLGGGGENTTTTTTTTTLTTMTMPMPPVMKQNKIVVFIFARVTSLMLMAMRYRDGSVAKNHQAILVGVVGANNDGQQQQSSSTDEYYGGRKKVMTAFLQRLVRVCSLSLLAKAALEKEGDAAANRNRVALLEMIIGLRSKAELYLTKIFGDFSNANAVTVGLEGFVSLSSRGVSDAINQNNTSLAKLLLMKYVMEKLLATTDPVCTPETNSMIKFYETLLFEDVSKCHHLFQPTSGVSAQAMEILSDLLGVLENASHLLCHSEKVDWQKTLLQQHHLLVRWLAPTSAMTCNSSTHNISKNHPLTNEVLLHVLYKRIMSSCAVENDVYSNQDSTHLISLLSQLLFHQRTEIAHRRNIATLLIRLLSSATETTANAEQQNNAKSLTVQLMWITMKQANVIYSTQRKRKRSKVGAVSQLHLLAGDVHVICWVLEALAKSSILTQTNIIDHEVSAEMKVLWDGILNNNVSNCKSNPVVFFLSMSVGALKASTKLEYFYQSFDRCVPKGTKPSAFIDATLTFAEGQVAVKSGRHESTRRVILSSLCIHLVGALSGCAGREMSETQFTRMGNILKDASTTTRTEQSTSSICLQYETVKTVSKMANIIQPNFGDGSVKVRLLSVCLYLTL